MAASEAVSEHDIDIFMIFIYTLSVSHQQHNNDI